MANPQIENGYLKIANELVKNLAKTYISGREWQVLWHILRKTWCWEKKADWITLQQFSQATGIPRKECFTYLKRLEKKGIVLTHWDKNKKTYGFNKDYSSWRLSQPVRTCPNPVGRLSQPVRTDCPNQLGTTIEPLTKEPLTKESNSLSKLKTPVSTEPKKKKSRKINLEEPKNHPIKELMEYHDKGCTKLGLPNGTYDGLAAKRIKECLNRMSQDDCKKVIRDRVKGNYGMKTIYDIREIFLSRNVDAWIWHNENKEEIPIFTNQETENAKHQKPN